MKTKSSPTTTFTVSQSKLKLWRRCHNAFHYKYVEHLVPKRIERPLVFGRAVHEIIEADLKGQSMKSVLVKYDKEIKKVFSSEREDYRQIISDVEVIMPNYFDYYADSDLKPYESKKTGLMVEREFNVPLCNGINIKGKIDAVMGDRQKRVWLTEHKSHKEIPSEEVRFRDIQTVIYGEILPDLGIPSIDGVMWDYIRSKPPTVPALLKSGELSKAQIDTLPTVYVKAIKDNKLNPKDYADKLKELKGSEKNFFKRIFMPLKPAIIKQVMLETIQTAKEIKERMGEDRTRNMTRDCDWCSYKALCRAELLGHDAHFVRKKEYTVEDNNERTQ